jgi:hypothetical protein
LLDIGHSQRPSAAERPVSIEIGLLSAPARAKSRGNPLREEDLAALRTAPHNPPLAHALSNSAKASIWLF